MLRFAKIFLVFAAAVWGLLGTIGNLADISTVYEQVREVTTMSGIPEGVGPPWRTANPVVVSIGVLAIVLAKVAALTAGVGGVHMLKNVNAGTAEFERSKKLAVAGCAVAFGLIYLSFTVAAEGAFFMFYSPRFADAGELAFRLSGSLGLIAIFVAQREPAT